METQTELDDRPMTTLDVALSRGYAPDYEQAEAIAKRLPRRYADADADAVEAECERLGL